MRAHRFLLEVHAVADADELREVIPRGLSRVISSDRASFNEIDTAVAATSIVPTPVPAWWRRFGEVYSRNLMDHPLWKPRVAPALNRVVSLADPRVAAGWKRSALCHEYFIPLGVKHQISTLISKRGTKSIGIAINRFSREFSPQDRGLLALLSPHLAQAWRNALALADVRRGGDSTEEQPTGTRSFIAVDAARGTIRSLSPEAPRILQKYFGTQLGVDNRLPDELHGWLRAQQVRLASSDDFALGPLPALEVKGAGGGLKARFAQHSREEIVVLLESARAATGRPSDGFTPRETEILHWLAEGKRNSEIGLILGISARTVGKHLEHVFEKLGVETRTAAVRAAAEFQGADHA